jgi:ribosomal protein S12 methylthiotransferase accessory factor
MLTERGAVVSTASPEPLEPSSTIFVIILVDSYLDPRLHQAVSATNGTLGWIPAKLTGTIAWIGPTFVGDQCELRWQALSQRLRDNHPLETALLATTGTLPLPPLLLDDRLTHPSLALLTSETLAAITFKEKAPLSGVCLTLDGYSLETTHHRLYTPLREPDHTPIFELEREQYTFETDTGYRICSPTETLARLEPLIGPITGIIPRVDSVGHTLGSPVFGAVQTFPGNDSVFVSTVAGPSLSAGGKGSTSEQARVSCLGEAVERYSAGFRGTETLQSGTLAHLDEPGIPLNALLLFSKTQYQNRDELNLSRGAFHYIPPPLAPDVTIDWTKAWSLQSRSCFYVPTAFCYFNYFAPLDTRAFCFADSNGCASGNTKAEAILAALCELIERDACAIWWYNRLPRPRSDPSMSTIPFVRHAPSRHAQLGRMLTLIDLTSDIGVPVTCAVSATLDGHAICFGLGCHLDGNIAAARAVAEVDQFLASTHSINSVSSSHSGNFELANWLRDASLADHSYLLPIGMPEPLADVSTRSILGDIEYSLTRLKEIEIDALAVDLTRSEVGFPVVRVITPGLRHFWQRLGPGRLYDVPIKMGWLRTRRLEHEMNPVPFFL